MSIDTPPIQTPPMDKAALRRKYAKERDKRLRADGNEQYLRIHGKLSRYLDDPYTPLTARSPMPPRCTPPSRRASSPRRATPSSPC